MAIIYSYRVISNKKKQIEIEYHKSKLKFQLKVKRAFIILKALLKEYPNFVNIHSLDKVYHDPNRAHSSLRNEDGFTEFLIEKKGERNVNHVKIDIDKLFTKFKGKDSKEFIKLAGIDQRKIITDRIKEEIYTKFDGRCNITRIKLFKKLPSRYFYKRVLEATYDHRIPLTKGGKDKISNLQLTSVLANAEKNNICNNCHGKDCKYCALAFPEKNEIIQMNGQNISYFGK